MKRYLLITLVVCGVLGAASPGWCYLITNPDTTTTDVGDIDPFVTSGIPSSYSFEGELKWVNDALGTSYTEDYFVKIDASPDFTEVNGTAGIYAFELEFEPSYFYLKIANEGLFLYQNIEMLNWGVVDFRGLLASGTINDVYAVSHYGAPVPEPATMLLLGSGLVGLAGIGRKRFLGGRKKRII